MILHLAMAFLMLTTLTASAQAQERAPAPSQEPVRRADLTTGCARRDGLSLCVDTVRSVQARARRALKAKVGSLNRFTRMAGMFMGRVDAAEFGPMKVRFNLEFR